MWLLIAKYSLISGISWVPFCRPWGWCWQRLGIMCCSTLFCWITVEWFTRAWNHQTSNCKFVSTGETYLRAPLLCLGWGGTPLLSLRWRWASTWWNSRLCSRLCRLRYVSHWSTATIRRLPRWSRGTSAIHCCHLCTYKKKYRVTTYSYPKSNTCKQICCGSLCPRVKFYFIIFGVRYC